MCVGESQPGWKPVRKAVIIKISNVENSMRHPAKSVNLHGFVQVAAPLPTSGDALSVWGIE